MRLALAMLPLIPQLLVCSQAQAQGRDPWTTTLSLSRKVLSTGECSVVALDLKDASTKEWPRGPNGTRVSMADFDLRVTAPAAHAAVGQYDGPNSFAVCACPKAPAGTVATVTATYPSETIAQKVKAPGVSFATSVTTPIVAGSSSGNPPGCDANGATTVMSTGRARPWTVTVQPTMSLPIGSCGVVSLTLRDSSGKDWPRTPAGNRVSLADFDFTVAASGGSDVVGTFDGASSYSACGCQSGTVGERATVTATYPARGLTAKTQVPDMALTAAAPFTLAAARGASNPAGCLEKQRQIASASGREAAGGAAPPTTPALRSVPPTLEGPVASTPRTRGVIPSAGAAPTNVVLTGTPLLAHLSWSATPNAQRYAVWRGTGSAVSIERTPANFSATDFADTVPDPHAAYRYAVIAYYADGTKGEAAAVSFTSPPMVNPSAFTATHLGSGNVKLQWQLVPGATRYRITGTGVQSIGLAYSAVTTATLNLVPSGPGAWKVTAVYPGNFSDSSSAPVATAMVRVLPSHSQQWLTKNNGAGNTSLANAHYATLCAGPAPCLHALESVVTVGNLAVSNVPFWGDPQGNRVAEEAVYGNVTDLGYGRRTNCTQVLKGPPVVGLLTMCYTTSHGAGPGESGFADPMTITRAAAGETPATDSGTVYGGVRQPYSRIPWGGMPRSGTVIIKDGAGSFYFYAFTPGAWDLSPFDQSVTWNTWAQQPSTLQSLTFDSEGAKAVPHSCLSCHGGQWNSSTNRVTGASFLPLDPGALVFGVTQAGDRTTYERSGQEERVRRINQIVAMSAPGSAVANYINGLYNGAVNTPGAVARTDFVPSGWSAQSGFYLSTVKPYCASCHLAAPSSVNFASWGNFLQNKVAIQNAVCVAHTMPHAEIPFRAFWTKDTGVLYLPGLLATTLGYPSC